MFMRLFVLSCRVNLLVQKLDGRGSAVKWPVGPPGFDIGISLVAPGINDSSLRRRVLLTSPLLWVLPMVVIIQPAFLF
jgi:hypothetical protein